MSPDDVCDVYVDGALVRTDTYDERYAEAQAAAQAAEQAAQTARAAQQAAHDQAEALKQFALTFTRPNMYIYGILALVIGFLILRVTKASSRYQERIRRYSPNPVPVRQARISYSRSYATPTVSAIPRVPSASTQSSVPSPTDAESHNRRGNTLFDSKRYEEALAAFDQAISLDPSNLAYKNRRGVVLFNLKRYEEAVAAFDQAIKLAPTNALFHDNQGNALYELKRYEEAVAAFDQAIKLAPTNAAYRSHREAVIREWPSAAKPPQPIPAPPASFQTFTSSDNSFNITYPGDWQQQAASSGTGTTFTSQSQQDAFVVTAVKLGTSQADLATAVSTACSKVGGTPSSPQTVSIGGQPWTKAECDYSGGSNHMVVEAVDYKGNRFVIVYGSPKTSFDSNANQFFTPMEQSFQFLS